MCVDSSRLVAHYKRRVEEALRRGHPISNEFIKAMDKWLDSETPISIGDRVQRINTTMVGVVSGVDDKAAWVFVEGKGYETFNRADLVIVPTDGKIIYGKIDHE